MSDVTTAWEQIERVLAAEAPEVFVTLAAGANEGTLADLERAIGRPVPADLRQSLARHDGQRDHAWLLCFAGYDTLMTAAEIGQNWAMLTELATAFERDAAADRSGLTWVNWWRPSCVPFAHDGGGDFVCVDADPTIHPDADRILVHVHDGEFDPTGHRDYTAWLTGIAAALVASRFGRNEYGRFRVNLHS